MLDNIKKNDLKPHKSEYWLFPKIGNWKAFVILPAIRDDL